MTLPKPLILNACEPTNDILTLEDEDTGTTIDFVSFGEISYHDQRYLFGMEYEDYDHCFGNQGENLMLVQLLEIQESATGEPLYSTVMLSEEDEKAIFDCIKFSLESVIVASKYGIN